MRARPSSERHRQKRAATTRVVAEIEDGMVLGLGSGSTAAFAIEALASAKQRKRTASNAGIFAQE